MPSFSQRSIDHLTTCDVDLQELFFHIILQYDCTIIEGHRTKDAQDLAVEQGRSKTPWPTSKHNASPSLAADVGPYIPGRGIPWPQTPDWNNRTQRDRYIKDLCQWYHFAGWVEATARYLGLNNVRWGGDWDRDHNIADQTFNDLPHFEIVKGPSN